MKLRKKFLAAASVAAAAAILAAVPAMAGTYTTDDKVLSLTTPDDTWKEIHDPNTWVTLGNGEDTITLLHYSNGETLPQMTTAGDKYSKVYQTVLSTRNEVFVVTGSVVNATNFSTVRKAVESAVINTYDTKTAVSTKNQKPQEEYTIEDTEFTGYVMSEGLNVRSSYSADSERIGGYEYADEVKVTGIVEYQGSEAGWYRINYDGMRGFVAAQFISDEKPEQEEEKEETIEKTGNVVTLYSVYGYEWQVYEYSDGTWRGTDNNLEFIAEGAGQWVCEDGSQWSTDPSVYEEAEGWDEDAEVMLQGDNQMILKNNDGNYVVITQLTDASWMDEDGRKYTAEGGGQWSCTDGSTWYIKED